MLHLLPYWKHFYEGIQTKKYSWIKMYEGSGIWLLFLFYIFQSTKGISFLENIMTKVLSHSKTINATIFLICYEKSLDRYFTKKVYWVFLFSRYANCNGIQGLEAVSHKTETFCQTVPPRSKLRSKRAMFLSLTIN